MNTTVVCLFTKSTNEMKVHETNVTDSYACVISVMLIFRIFISKAQKICMSQGLVFIQQNQLLPLVNKRICRTEPNKIFVLDIKVFSIGILRSSSPSPATSEVYVPKYACAHIHIPPIVGIPPLLCIYSRSSKQMVMFYFCTLFCC